MTPLLPIKPAPHAVLDRLPTHATKPRFHVREGAGWRTVTWGQYAAQIRGVARWLVEHGLAPGDRVAIFAPNSVAWASAALGIQAAGGMFVPIYPASTAEQTAYILGHCGARFVFVDGRDQLARIEVARAGLGTQVVPLADAAWLADAAAADADAAAAAAAAADATAAADDATAAADDAAAAAAAAPNDDSGSRNDHSAAANGHSATANGHSAAANGHSAAANGPSATANGPSAIRDAAERDAADSSLVDARLAALDLDEPAQLLYTSGTSGNPKGVPLSHRNTGTNGRDWLVCNAPLVAEGQRDLLWLPMSHIFGFGELVVGNTLGWETYLATPADALEVLPAIAPDVFFSVPAYWEKLARSIAADGLAAATGGKLSFCLSGGAGLKVEIKDALHRAGLLIIEGYGLTETSPTLTLNRPDAFRFDTVGKVLPSVEVRLADDGEILARGANVFRGYYNDPDATAAAFTPDGWFCTGDIGRFTDDGFLQIIDRKKDILVTAGGKNIPPANIEARFADDPIIDRVVVYGDARAYLVAAVWVRPGAPADQVAARVDAVNAELARYETIKRHFVVEAPLTVEDGTLTSSLKMRRKAVYERLRARFEALYA
ncbi:MAG TPA: AMP-dependent synthetase/ligase [Kofleriaceae bacterium]